MTTRRAYTQEFKESAIGLVEVNGNKAEVARDLGINVSILRRWVKESKETGKRAFPGSGNSRDVEMARIEKENRRLKEENAILKKAVGIFSVRP